MRSDTVTHDGVEIAGEKKTTIFRVTVVQRPFCRRIRPRAVLCETPIASGGNISVAERATPTSGGIWRGTDAICGIRVVRIGARRPCLVGLTAHDLEPAERRRDARRRIGRHEPGRVGGPRQHGRHGRGLTARGSGPVIFALGTASLRRSRRSAYVRAGPPRRRGRGWAGSRCKSRRWPRSERGSWPRLRRGFPFSKPVSAGLIQEDAFEKHYRESRTRGNTRTYPQLSGLLDTHRLRERL